MSMDLGGAKGGVKSDINVTPLVDVMLVLLIIMMLVAPMLEQGVSVKLPKAANATAKPQSSDQTIVAIGANRAFYVNAQPVPRGRAREQGQGRAREPRPARKSSSSGPTRKSSTAR